MSFSEEKLDIIRTSFKKHFDIEDNLWVFGSRVDEEKRGGDLDFYVETHQHPSNALKSKLAFVNDLWRSFGDQKIDVILNLLTVSLSLPIHSVAKQTGVQIA